MTCLTFRIGVKEFYRLPLSESSPAWERDKTPRPPTLEQ